MDIFDFAPLTSTQRVTVLLGETDWALGRGLLTFDADGLNFTALGRVIAGAYRSVEADDAETGRASAAYAEGCRLHWLAVALGTGEPIEAVDSPHLIESSDQGATLLSLVTAHLPRR